MVFTERTTRPALAMWAALVVSASAAALSATPRAIPFDRLTIDDGLPQATVHCLLQDREGFLWVGTQAGLGRYDGYGFRVYKHVSGDATSLPANWIHALAEDPSGDLWVGTQGAGLVRWRRETGRFERPETWARRALPDAFDDTVRDLLVTPDGDVWAATWRSGLVHRNGSTGGVEVFRHRRGAPTSLSDDRTRGLALGADGSLWVATLGGLDRLVRSADGGVSIVQHRHDPEDPTGLPDDRVYAVLEDSSGTLWVGTEGGLARARRDAHGGILDFERFTSDPNDPTSLADPWVTDLLEDDEGRLWVATDDGLALFRDDRFDVYRHDPSNLTSLSNDRLLTLFQDRGGVLWVGTQGGGLNRWHPRTWRFGHVRQIATGDTAAAAVFAFAEDPAGRLLVGSFGSGVGIFDRKRGALEPAASLRHDPDDPTSLPGEQVTALYVDQRQQLWVGTLGQGLGRTDAERPGSFRRYRHDPGQPGSISDDDIVTVLEDRRGVLWLTTHGGGLNRYEPERDAFRVYRHDPQSPTSLAADDLNALAVDRDDGLWIGTLGRGLDRLDPDRRQFRHVRHDDSRPDSLGSDTVFSLHLDADDTLWVGHAFGLDRLLSIDAETSRFRHYTERDGLPDSSVWSVRSDARGRLWIATNHGLASLDPQTEVIRAYGVRHGLQAGEFNLGAHHRGRDGMLYFGGVNGFNAFDPERLGANRYRPPLRITSLVIAGYEGVSRRDSLGDRLELGHRDHHFDVELAALDFSAPEHNRYRYRLEGREDEWIDLGTRRQLSFAGLDDGEYVLHIQGSNSDGAWSSDDVSLEVTVLPPPWRTGWAYSLYGLICVAVVSSYVRQHRGQLERERQISERLRTVDRMREELIANTSHELRTPLFGIGGLAEAMLDDPYVVRSPITRQHLETIVVSTRRLNSLVDDLLDLSELRHDGGVRLEPSAVNLRALATDVLHLARPMVGERRIELAHQVGADLPSVLADEDRLHQILINLVGNAIKFTDQGRVEITAAEVAEDQIEIRVTDTGIGIGAEDHERIFEPFEQVDGSNERRFGGTGLGLTVSRRLVELHDSRLAVTSAVGAGATFSFTLPPAEANAEPADEPSTSVARRRDRPPRSTTEPAFEPAAPPRKPDTTPPDAVASSARSARILVVDDEPVNRLVLSQHLADAGLQIVEASSGPEALTYVDRQAFDLVLLDVMMPAMSGYEVCRRLRERFARHELPIIFLTAKTQLADRLAGFAEGANDFLTKPVAKREMLARVETQLELLFLARHQSRLLTERSEQLETLGGLLPICAKCKKIRDDDGYWEQIETFIQEHSNARLTHGFCPPCADSYYAEIEAMQLERSRNSSSPA